ncbi:DUF6350 family protein [Gordonia sp. DT30]|uniref:cell division protein PerM n=1 Tax=unclassified Gordonia (in: high G+C Gram-positive bacteria) TaxID=2657482 RepID=UPI003CEB5286
MPTLRTVASTDNLATRLRDARQARRAHHERPERGPRELILVAFAVPVVTVVLALVVVLAVLLMAGSGLSGVASAVAACWLAINQVPITVAGVTIGVLPMLPTLLVAGGTAAVVASSCRARHTISEFVAVVCSAIAGALLVTAIALAVVMDGSSVLPIQSPNALAAFGLTFVVQGLAAAAGVVIGRSELLASRLSVTDRRGIRYGFVAVLGLVAAGGLLILLRLILRFDALGDLVAGGYDFDGYLGLTLLSILYLPNLMVGAAAVLVGSEVHVGPASADLFAVRGAPVPPLPALAVLPAHSVWWAAWGLLVPALIAGWVAWRCRTADPLNYARSIGMAAAVAATTMVIFGWLAGGTLGEIGTTGITLVTAGVFTLGWIAALGLAVWLVQHFLPSMRTRTSGSRRADTARTADDWLDAENETDFDAEYETGLDVEVESDAANDDDHLAADLDDLEDDGDLEDLEADGEYEYGDDDLDEPDLVAASDGDAVEPATEERHGTTRRRAPAARVDPDDVDEGTWSFADPGSGSRANH